MRRLTLLAALSLAALSSTLSAQQIRTEPAAPQAGQPFQITVSGFWPDSIAPAVREVFLPGSNVIVITLGAEGNGDPVVTPFVARADVPALAAGTYDVRVRTAGTSSVKRYARAPIVVAGAPPDFVPLSATIGGTAGGTTVVFNAIGCATFSCEGAKVFFGDKPAASVQVAGPFITAVTPPGSRVGPVDVKIRFSIQEMTVPSAFTYVSPQQYETILLPSFTDREIPGAFGSRWRVEHGVYNGNDVELEAPVDFMNLEIHCQILCPGNPTIPALRVAPIPSMEPYTRSPNWLLHVRKPLDTALRFSLRVRDLSRADETWGTELPVVHERDFAQRVQLFDVPLQARFRQNLRIYALPQGTTCCTDVTVRFYAIDTNALLHETTAKLILPPAAQGSPEFPAQPETAELSSFGNIAALAGHDRVRVEVDGGSRLIWAYVSVTNNDTQDVTVVSPQ
jgi:hypothetical protein